jgi:hypothetical protein
MIMLTCDNMLLKNGSQKMILSSCSLKTLSSPFASESPFPCFKSWCQNLCSIVELAYTKGVQKYVNPSSSYYICYFSLVWFILFLLCSIKSFLLVCLFVVFTGFFVRSYRVKFFKVYCSFISLGQSL